MFTWMIHVFPFENDLKDVFSMNDDVPHFGVGAIGRVCRDENRLAVVPMKRAE